MGKQDIKNDATGVLSRLLRDQSGNTIAILAAAVIPVIGLVGGGVDMSRIYLAQSRLQGACDAGALMGRKVMGPSTWSANSNKANTEALRMFDLNYQNGSYGTANLSRSFEETAGNVVGTASVDVPMALMQVLGVETRTITASCQAELRIPNTDVMFVLDTTGSMNGTANGSGESKISGLRKAVKCFYEALAKQNIDDISPSDCGETANPSTANSGSVQLRFGFVPYAVNVNVGKLLPLDFMADQWTYQSRQAKVGLVPNGAPTYGTESSPVNTNTSNSNTGNSGWTDTEENVVQGSNTFNWYISTTKKQCKKLNEPNNEAVSDPGTTDFWYQDPANPVYPTASVNRYYRTISTTGTRVYNYYYAGGNLCKLESQIQSRVEKTVTSRTTVPVSYTQSMEYLGWDYKPVTFNVSQLKNTNSNSWQSSLALPLGDEGADINIAWKGCIEERQTFKATDTDPSDDWDPIPTSAKDMNIDMLPDTNDATTQWGPSLPNTVWERYTIANDGGGNYRTGNRTTSDVFVNKDDNITMPMPGNNCPSESRKFQTWTPTDFKNYVNGLAVGGNTYHDIGLLWGARIMSPSGIFAALNAPADTIIERHMVFMTDGGTNSILDDYSAYGINWYDRRQTQNGIAPYNSLLNATVDARTAAICKAVKNKNITLWVVSYGSDVDTATNTRLSACATPGKFFQATSVSALVNQFKSIAAEISALRLTQ